MNQFLLGTVGGFGLGCAWMAFLALFKRGNFCQYCRKCVMCGRGYDREKWEDRKHENTETNGKP